MKFKSIYDEGCDHFVIHKVGFRSEDCQMVLPQLVIDFDKNKRLVAVEFLDTEMLRALNPLLTKKFLGKIEEVEVSVKKHGQHLIIGLAFRHDGRLIEEKLPLFSFVSAKAEMLA